MNNFQNCIFFKFSESIELNKRMIQQLLMNTMKQSQDKYEKMKESMLNDPRLNFNELFRLDDNRSSLNVAFNWWNTKIDCINYSFVWVYSLLSIIIQCVRVVVFKNCLLVWYPFYINDTEIKNYTRGKPFIVHFLRSSTKLTFLCAIFCFIPKRFIQCHDEACFYENNFCSRIRWNNWITKSLKWNWNRQILVCIFSQLFGA